MRKADYTLLAMLLSVEIRAARQNMRDGCDVSAQTERFLTCVHLARNFANAASVNEIAFLKACGIE